MPERSKYYILVGGQPVPCDLPMWAQWFGSGDQHMVKKTQVGDVKVSTVFLGLDHNYSPTGPPLIFETMVFGGKMDQEEWRYSTKEEALLHHEEVVEMVRKAESPLR